MSNKQVVTARFPKDDPTPEQLRKYAKKDGTTVSRLVVKILSEWAA